MGIPQLMFAIAFLASQGTPVEFLCAAKDPNMLAVEGCPDPSWDNCTYIPPAECREEYETCNKYVVGGDPNKPCDPTAVDDCKTGDCTATETCDPERYLGNGKCSTLDMRHVAPHASHTPHSPHLCRQVQHARGLPEADGADRADLVLVRDR